MSNNINYKDQIKQLENIIDKINSLSINKKELNVIEDLVRNLYERIIIIKHNLEEPYTLSEKRDKENSQKLDSEEEGDFQDESARKKILTAFNGSKVDLILSDMAPNLSGIKVVDGENISDLVNLVLDFSVENLHKNGCVVVKTFETGTGSREFRKKLAKYFEKLWLRKPSASKKVSSEQFLIAKTLK